MSSKDWKINDLPDLTGKNIIVTGGNSGLGYEAVKALSGKGAKVTIACRSMAKGEQAMKAILEVYPKADIDVSELDLADLQSIKSFATKYCQNHDQLDLLLNNAGIMMTPYQLTKDGFESQMGVNHLGHFALTGLLLELLRKTPNSRVVNVSSMAHKQGSMDYDNLLFNRKSYTPLKAYGRSKLSNLLFTYELQRFFESNKLDCKALVAHPGVSDTNLFQHITSEWIMNLLKPLVRSIIQPANMGVLPELRAATDLNAKGGEFYGPNGKLEMKGHPVLVQPIAAAQDTESAGKLWEASEKLTGIIYK